MTSTATTPQRPKFEPAGVIPAVLLPFDADLNIDEAAFRKHLRDVTGVHGVTAITVNGHSTEVTSCTLDEQARVLDIALSTVGDTTPVIAGIYTESTAQAARSARAAAQAGASALLVFAPGLFSGGAVARPDMTLAHYKRIADVTDLPIILFQFPMVSGIGTPLDTVVRLADEVPNLAAIKDYSNNPVVAERNVRVLQSRAHPVNVLTSHSSWLLGSLVLGCKGILSGAGSTVAELHVALLEAVQRGDLAAARAVADRLFPVNEAFYGDPFLDMHNRMKEAQVLLGRLPAAHVRGPLLKPGPVEIDRIAAALAAAGLLR